MVSDARMKAWAIELVADGSRESWVEVSNLVHCWVFFKPPEGSRQIILVYDVKARQVRIARLNSVGFPLRLPDRLATIVFDLHIPPEHKAAAIAASINSNHARSNT